MNKPRWLGFFFLFLLFFISSSWLLRAGQGSANPRDQEGLVEEWNDPAEPEFLTMEDLANWEIHTLAIPKQFGWFTDRALGIDSQGIPHIAYGGDHLYHAWQEGNTWQVEIVDSSNGVGSNASLGIAADDTLHISYHAGGLRHAVKHDGSWVIADVDPIIDLYAPISLDLDHEGRPNIAFTDPDTNYGLKYARFTDRGWQVEAIQDIGPMTSPSLVMDLGGQPHFIANDYDGHQLKHVFWGQSGWQWEVIDSDSDGNHSAVLDLFGQIQVSYAGPSNELRVATSNMIGWEIESLAAIHPTLETVIQVDSDSFPHILRLAPELPEGREGTTIFRVNYHFKDAGGWHHQVIDPGIPTSIALDGSDQPHVIFQIDSSLMYAVYNDVFWDIEQVDKSTNYYFGINSLVMDSGGSAHVVYVDEKFNAENHIIHAVFSAGEWVTETVEILHTRAPHIAIDGEDRPHLLYTNSSIYPTDIRYGVKGPSGWIFENSQVVTAFESLSDFALGPDGFPHFVYDLSACNRGGCTYWWYYVYKDQEGWSVEEMGAGGGASLEVDDLGRPHIIFHNIGCWYAVRDAGVWHILEVETEATGCPCDIALDPAGRPQLLVEGEEGVALVTFDQGVWDTWWIDGVSNVSDFLLDPARYPHFLYFDQERSALVYTYRNVHGWFNSVVEESSGGVSLGGTLALDASNIPHILYYGEGGELKFARYLGGWETIFFPVSSFGVELTGWN